MNHFTRVLSQICHDRLIDEKWLIAPSLRVGHQWLLTVTRNGQPVVNCHVKTITSVALELAGPEMAASGVELVSRRGGEMVIDQILQRVRQPGVGYLWQLPPSAGLTRAIYAAVEALRVAGLKADELPHDRFEVSVKGRELAEVLPTIQRGVIDLLFLEPTGWVVVDYKTDDVALHELPRLVDHYRPQVKGYAEAWQRLVQQPVREKGLFFTRTNCYLQA